MSTNQPLRWGLLSTARINRAVIAPLRASPRNELTAVASRTTEAAQAYAQERDIARFFGSYEAMLADPDIDVIYNPLPNSLHAEWSIKAAAAGKHVLCEKPLALTVEEVEAIAAAAQQAGVVIAEAFMYRHHPQTIKVKALVDEGAIGRLQWVRGAFTFMLNRPGDVRRNAALGGGSIWDIGCYPINFARYVVGAEPVELFGWQTAGDEGVDETFTGQMRFPGGQFAQFYSGFQTDFHAVVELVGSDGRITIPQPFLIGEDAHITLTRGGEVEQIVLPAQDAYLAEIEDMADAILLGKSPRVSLDDSRANVAAVVALLESARTGRPTAPT